MSPELRCRLFHVLGYLTVLIISPHSHAQLMEGGLQQRCEPEETQEDVNVLLQSTVSNLHAPSASLEKSASQLDSAAGLLSKILLGSVSKSQVEIVLAHHHESVAWSDPYKHIRTIYCKGKKKDRPAGCIHLPNVGREGHTYLHHIVKNYDRLAEWTVFTQAQAPTQGYKGHRLGGGHALPGIPFDAYVLPENAGGLPREDGSVFVFTGAVHMPTLNHSLRLSFQTAAYAPTLHQQSKCPTIEHLDGWQKWWDLGWFKKWIGGKCGVAPEAVPKLFNDYWDEYIRLPRPDHDIIFFSQGARFAASRERIRQRPKEFYEALLQKLSSNADPCHNYFNEWIWYYMIGAPSGSPCDSGLVLEEANSKEQVGRMLLNEVSLHKMRVNETAAH